MDRAIFGTDGIRGAYGTYPMTDDGARRIAKTAAAYFLRPGDRVVIGCDPRESSPALVRAITDGLVCMGAHVLDLGVLPTPGLAYLTKHLHAKLGIMVTASHNPYTDNGIKIFTENGDKLPDDTEAKLSILFASTIAECGGGSRMHAPDALHDYEASLVASAGNASFGNLHLAVDTANGSMSGIAERVLSKLHARVVPIFDKPDGRNINTGCGATDTRALQSAVKQYQANAGLAFDGDADRMIPIDEHGRPLTGEHILYILALTNHEPGIVTTIMSNMALDIALKQQGITAHRTAVGDRYVLEGMQKTGFRLGGEQAGHTILADYATGSDGLLTAIRLLAAVQNSGKSLAAWRDELQLLPQKLINLPIADKSLLEHRDMQAYIAMAATELDGKGRLLVRPSGTEPVVRVMVEAPDAEARAEQIAGSLQRLARHAATVPEQTSTQEIQ